MISKPIYRLVLKREALKEWKKLDSFLRVIFVKKLRERLVNPCILRDRLFGTKDCYKIKLRRIGYRLIHEVRHQELVLSIIAVGKREKNQVYHRVRDRL